MRRAHWLRSIQSAAFPHELVCFDTETVEVRRSPVETAQQFQFGWAARSEYTSRETWTEPEWFRFGVPVDFWQWLETRCRSKRALHIYCHNANFDWQTTDACILLPQLGWSADTLIFDDPPNYMRWRKGDKTLKLLDTTNYWKRSLKDIGHRIGLEKYDLPTTWTDAEIGDRYCKRDVEILLTALQQWIAWLRAHNLGGLGISLAQQAWRAYLHTYYDYPIYIDDNEEGLAVARAAYYGGRTEAWTVGTFLHDVRCLDVNSMYPYVMQQQSYPTRLHGVYKRVKHDELARWLRKYALCAQVTIDTDTPIYPLRSDDGLLFPVGQFDTFLSTPELAEALVRGHLARCNVVALYEHAPVFTRFVTELYKLRQDLRAASDEAGVFFVKILLNSLYGKFGQRSGNEVIIGDCDPSLFRVEDELDIDTGTRYRLRYIAGKILSRERTTESRYSHPAIAAHVTAYARMLLWRLIEQAQPQNVHYMDTDSLHVNQKGFGALQTLIDPDRLGALKLEKSIDTAVYYGPKDYELDGVRTIKGVRRDAIEIDVGVYSQSQWVSLKGATVAEHHGAPLVRQVQKRFTRRYRKGTVERDNRVSPFRLAFQQIFGRVEKDRRL